MIKLIAADLDGTLLYPKRKISVLTRKNKNFLRDYVNDGNRVVIVSGRNIDISKHISKKIGTQVDMVACNGSLTLKDGKIINDSPMNAEDVKMLYEENKNNEYIMSWIFMSDTHPLVIVPVDINPLMTFFYRIGLFFQFKYLEKFVIGEKHLYNLLNDKSAKIYKVMPLFGLGKKGTLIARDQLSHFIDAYGTKFEILWSSQSIEFMNKGVNKAKALKELIKETDLNPNEIAVIGDSGNDIPLFETFENSFVMSHSPEEVKKAAKTQIDGVYCLKDYI